jgi:hypothetical protein
MRIQTGQAGKSWNEIKLMARNKVHWKTFIKALSFPEEQT